MQCADLPSRFANNPDFILQIELPFRNKHYYVSTPAIVTQQVVSLVPQVENSRTFLLEISPALHGRAAGSE